jgi:hypothetical protein
MSDEPFELSAEQVVYYREVLVAHGSVHGASMCHICGVAGCPDWVDAYDKLAAANAQMVDPSRLPPRVPERRR